MRRPTTRCANPISPTSARSTFTRCACSACRRRRRRRTRTSFFFDDDDDDDPDPDPRPYGGFDAEQLADSLLDEWEGRKAPNKSHPEGKHLVGHTLKPALRINGGGDLNAIRSHAAAAAPPPLWQRPTHADKRALAERRALHGTVFHGGCVGSDAAAVDAVRAGAFGTDQGGFVRPQQAPLAPERGPTHRVTSLVLEQAVARGRTSLLCNPVRPSSPTFGAALKRSKQACAYLETAEERSELTLRVALDDLGRIVSEMGNQAQRQPLPDKVSQALLAQQVARMHGLHGPASLSP